MFDPRERMLLSSDIVGINGRNWGEQFNSTFLESCHMGLDSLNRNYCGLRTESSKYGSV